MCGIAGYFEPQANRTREVAHTIATRMAETLEHRGPDDSGVWIDERAGIAFGHRRLSILDLSAQGHQPMVSHSGRYVLVFNGEIYNFRELREELDTCCRPPFRSNSDTEVMLAAFDRWGLDPALRKFNGMFAFALWDRELRTLTLARDRAGEKPLYYGWAGQSFLFGSELKALRAHPAFRATIDRNSATLFMRYSYVPAPYSIYEGIWKLLPATSVQIRDAGERPEPQPYWSLGEAVEAGVRSSVDLSDDEAVERLDSLLSSAVALRMVADVPLGAFLSGGIDSSTVVALMQKHSARPIRTFTIGFLETGFNEAEYAKKVAAHLGCDHTELYVTPAEAIRIVPELPTRYDEPFADSSQIPTYLVSRLARQQVTVSLSGDGGDELFGGYTRYLWAEALWRRMEYFPRGMRVAASRLLFGIPFHVWDRVLQTTNRFFPRSMRQSLPADKVQKIAGILPATTPEALYRALVSQWQDPASVVIAGSEPATLLTEPARWPNIPDFTNRMMFFDASTYLPDDILVKLDRASMAVSLESRVPMLDHRVIEFAWTLPRKAKIRGTEGKWVLRRVLAKYLPSALFERPKTGFAIPVHDWLRGPLRDWAESMVDASRLRREGFLNPEPVLTKWSEHLSGRRNWIYPLWNVLMFQAWLEHESAFNQMRARV